LEVLVERKLAVGVPMNTETEGNYIAVPDPWIPHSGGVEREPVVSPLDGDSDRGIGELWT
jgi:hypothetical protein